MFTVMTDQWRISLFLSLTLDFSVSEAAILSATSSSVWPTSHQPFHQPRDLHPASSPTLTLHRTQWGAQASTATLVSQGTALHPQ